MLRCWMVRNWEVRLEPREGIARKGMEGKERSVVSITYISCFLCSTDLMLWIVLKGNSYDSILWLWTSQSLVRFHDLWLAKDNRLLNPKSSYERILMAPTCRLINHQSTGSLSPSLSLSHSLLSPVYYLFFSFLFSLFPLLHSLTSIHISSLSCLISLFLRL